MQAGATLPRLHRQHLCYNQTLTIALQSEVQVEQGTQGFNSGGVGVWLHRTRNRQSKQEQGRHKQRVVRWLPCKPVSDQADSTAAAHVMWPLLARTP